MHFCLHCGVDLKRSYSTLCSICHSNDELNGPYCIICGASCEPLSSFDDESVSTSIPVFSSTAKDKNLSPTGIGLAMKHKELILAIVCLGLAIIYSMIFVNKLAGTGSGEKANLKRISQGLIIYTKIPYADLSIEDDQHHRLVSTKLKSDGSLTLDTLAPGNYIIRIAATNRKALLKRVKIVGGNPTVLGFPNPIDLPNQTKP